MTSEPVSWLLGLKKLLLRLWSCGREVRECGQAVDKSVPPTYPGFVHTARRARTGPQGASTNPQSFRQLAFLFRVQ